MADFMPRIRVGMATCIDKTQCLAGVDYGSHCTAHLANGQAPAGRAVLSINIEICQCMTNRFWYQIPVTEHDSYRSAADRRLKSATIVVWSLRHDNGVPETHT
jgi:hypothetical protein